MGLGCGACDVGERIEVEVESFEPVLGALCGTKRGTESQHGRQTLRNNRQLCPKNRGNSSILKLLQCGAVLRHCGAIRYSPGAV